MKVIAAVFSIVVIVVLILFSAKSDVQSWNESFAGGTHLVLAPIERNNIKPDEFIDKTEIEVFKEWLSQKGVARGTYLLKPLGGKKLLIQLPGEKYITASKERVENAGLNWQDFSQKLIKEGSAIQIKEDTIALKSKPIFKVPEDINKKFVDLVFLFDYAPVKEMLSVPSLELKLAKTVPESKTVLSDFEIAGLKEYQGEKFLLSQALDITSDDIENVYSSVSEYGDLVVGIQLNPYGTKKFADLTKAYIGEKVAVIYNGDILIVALIRERIVKGKIEIAGNLKKEEQENIFLKLKVSSLLAKYEIDEAEVLTKGMWVGRK